jgi:membrane associated rhomboid family serine protease
MNRNTGSTFSGSVFKLILVNIIVFAIQIFTESNVIVYSIGSFSSRASVLTFYLGLIPALITEKGFIWQIFSYMFLHSTHGFLHIFFNMYALLIFGVSIEQAWGARRFMLYYFFCGIGAGISIYLINLISSGMGYVIPTIGASGAIFGLLLAFGILYPNAQILLFFIIPIRAKYLVIMYGLLELYLELFGGQSNISHVGHLGGLFFGLVYFLIYRKRAFSFKGRLLKARFQRSISDGESLIRSKSSKSSEMIRDKSAKIEILKKLRESGPGSLTDDEIQLIKYIDIMTDAGGLDCPEGEFDVEGERCHNCDDFDQCFLHEVKKYL